MFLEALSLAGIIRFLTGACIVLICFFFRGLFFPAKNRIEFLNDDGQSESPEEHTRPPLVGNTNTHRGALICCSTQRNRHTRSPRLGGCSIDFQMGQTVCATRSAPVRVADLAKNRSGRPVFKIQEN